MAHDDPAMLRALSTAALEHAHTRELADEVRHTHTNSDWPDALDEVRGKGPKGLKLHAVHMIYMIYIYIYDLYFYIIYMHIYIYI